MGKGHFVIFSRIKCLECRGGLGGGRWTGLLEKEHGHCCGFRFVSVLFLNLGGCGLTGVGSFFFCLFLFFSCFLNCFKLQMFKRITSPPPPTETTVIKSVSGETGLLPPKPSDIPFPRTNKQTKVLATRRGRLSSAIQALVWGLGPGTGKRGWGRLCKHMLGIR